MQTALISDKENEREKNWKRLLQKTLKLEDLKYKKTIESGKRDKKPYIRGLGITVFSF